MNSAENIKQLLMQDIDSLIVKPELYAKNPGHDFTRSRKLPAKKAILFLIGMERDTMNRELIKYFDYALDTPSASAFYQQRKKFLPETFRPPSGQSKLGYSEIYVFSAYRLLDKVFTDAVIKPSHIKNEYAAICEMIDRCDKTHGTPLFLADRRFPSYNCFAHAEENRVVYLIRAKDDYVNRLLLDEKPDSDEFDVSVDRIIVRHKAKKSISIRNLLTNTVM